MKNMESQSNGYANQASDVRFSVVICTRNRSSDLDQCLESLQHQYYPPYEIIVVDSSDNNMSKTVTEHFRKKGNLTVKYSRSKPGLTRQRNEGISSACGDVYAFLDDDVILDEYYFRKMASIFKKNKHIGGATGNITNLVKENYFAELIRKLFLLTGNAAEGIMKRSGFPDYVDPDRALQCTPTQVLSGCNMLYRKEVFENFIFDEEFEGYCLGEDAEFSHRVSKCHRLVYIKDARLIHNRSDTERIDTYKYFKMALFNRYYIFKKNVKESSVDWLFFVWSTFGIGLRGIYWALKTRNFSPLQGLVEGFRSILKRVR
jgi:GT2 family glycosyltransferase